MALDGERLGATERRDPAHDVAAVLALDVELLDAELGVLVGGEPAGARVDVLVRLAAAVDQLLEQAVAVRLVLESRRLAGRVLDALEPALSADGQVGALPAVGDDRVRAACAVALDPRDVAVGVGERGQAAGVVVAEGQPHGAGQPVERPQVAAGEVELVGLRAVGRRHDAATAVLADERARHAADPPAVGLVAGGGDVERAVGRDRDAGGAGQRGLRRGAAVADVARAAPAAAPAAGHAVQDAVGRDAAHEASIDEHSAAVGHHVDREGAADARLGGGAAVAVAGLGVAAARDRADAAAGVELADAVLGGDHEQPVGPDGEAGRARQPRLGGRPAVAELLAAAGHRAEPAIGADVADDAVVDQAAAAEHLLADVDPAVGSDRDVAREAELHAGGRGALGATGAAAREREDHAVRRDPLDAVLDALGDVDGAVVGDADADRRAEVGGQRADVAVGVDPPHHADARAVRALHGLGEEDGAVGADLGLAEVAQRHVRAELAVALARDERRVAVAGRRGDDGIRVEAAAVTQVDGVVASVEPVVGVERPAAERLVARVEAADRGARLVAVLAPDDGVHPLAGPLVGDAAPAEAAEGLAPEDRVAVLDEAVLVADADGDRLGALDGPAVGVLAVPLEVVHEVGLRLVGAGVLAAGDLDLEEHALKAARHRGADERDAEAALLLVAGRTVAPVAQVERRAGDLQRLAEPLTLAADDRPGHPALLLGLGPVLVGDRNARRDGVERRRVRPVVVVRREVLDLDAPQALAGVIERGEPLALGVGDAEPRVGAAVAVGVDLGEAAALADDGDHAAVRDRHPLARLAVVVAARHDVRRPGSSRKLST